MASTKALTPNLKIFLQNFFFELNFFLSVTTHFSCWEKKINHYLKNKQY